MMIAKSFILRIVAKKKKDFITPSIMNKEKEKVGIPIEYRHQRTHQFLVLEREKKTHPSRATIYEAYPGGDVIE